MNFVLIYTTHKDQSSADFIVDKLLKDSLIACANFFPITSRYTWNNTTQNTSEVVAVLKTKLDNWDTVKKYIEENHPYDVPCIIKLAEVESNESYASWIQESTNQ